MSSTQTLKIPEDIVIKTIRSGGAEGVQMENYLYLQHHQCNRFMVLQNHGDDQDVSDNYHEAFMAILIKIRNGELREIQNFRAYLRGACYNLWMRELNRRGRFVTKPDLSEPLIESEELDGFDVQYDRALMKALSRLAKRCFEVLQKFYFEKERDNDVYVDLGFSTSAALRQKRKQCIAKLRIEYSAIQ